MKLITRYFTNESNSAKKTKLICTNQYSRPVWPEISVQTIMNQFYIHKLLTRELNNAQEVAIQGVLQSIIESISSEICDVLALFDGKRCDIKALGHITLKGYNILLTNLTGSSELGTLIEIHIPKKLIYQMYCERLVHLVENNPDIPPLEELLAFPAKKFFFEHFDTYNTELLSFQQQYHLSMNRNRKIKQGNYLVLCIKRVLFSQPRY